MPNLPDPEAIGLQSVQGRTGNIRIASDMSGLEATGNMLSSIAKNAFERQDKSDLIKAQSVLNSARIDVMDRLSRSDQYGDYENLYNEAMKEARAEAGKLVRGRRASALFEMDADSYISSGMADVKSASWTTEQKVRSATLKADLERGRRDIMRATSPSQREDILNEMNAWIDDAKSHGILVEGEDQLARQEATATASLAAVAALTPEEQVAILTSPDGTIADPKWLPQDMADAQLAWANNAIYSAETKQASRMSRAYSDGMIAMTTQVEQQGLASLQGSEDWHKLKVSDRKALIEYDKKLNEGTLTTDWQEYVRLQVMYQTDPQGFIRYFESESGPLRASMEDSEFKTISGWYNSARDNDQGAAAHAATRAQITQQALGQLDMDLVNPKNTKDMEKAARFHRMMGEAIDSWQSDPKNEGRNMPESEMRAVAERLVQDEVRDRKWLDTSREAFLIDDPDDVPTWFRQQAQENLGALTEQSLLDLYQAYLVNPNPPESGGNFDPEGMVPFFTPREEEEEDNSLPYPDSVVTDIGEPPLQKPNARVE